MLNDLFSHKIHASDLENWKRKLVKLAQVFETFDGQPFNRQQFDTALKFLSPTTARSPFRDIYSIYMSILGVGHIVREQDLWICRLTETARHYLTGAEPNVEAFCRLQLALYQRPDGRGQQYKQAGAFLEHQSQAKTLAIIHQNYKICPLRLILKIFEAKAKHLNELQDSIRVTPEEVYTLANAPSLKSNPSPSIRDIREALNDFYNGALPIIQGERRFPFLEATGLLIVDHNNNLSLYPYRNPELNAQRNRQIEAIKSLEYFFEGFNHCIDIEEVYEVLEEGKWSEYFDACKTLTSIEVQAIAGEVLIAVTTEPLTRTFQSQPQPISRLAKRNPSNKPSSKTFLQRQPQRANPENTKVLMERRNAWHELLVEKMRTRIEASGFTSWETELIDLGVDIDNTAQLYPNGIPNRGTYLEDANLAYFNPQNSHQLTFIFEMKSSDDSILGEQVRKAVSQLYEYRYLHRKNEQIHEDCILAIVLQSPPTSIPWLKEYLLNDRYISVCWFQGNDSFDCFDECRPILDPLIAS
ncbi:hypothetical protein AB3R30_12070 [Leptolyngbyaceae cyanobacterium UHCC 1019]